MLLGELEARVKENLIWRELILANGINLNLARRKFGEFGESFRQFAKFAKISSLKVVFLSLCFSRISQF